MIYFNKYKKHYKNMTKNIEKTLDFKVEIYYNSSMGCFAPIKYRNKGRKNYG